MAFKNFILCILQIGAIYGQMSDDMSIMDIINATAQLSEVNSKLTIFQKLTLWKKFVKATCFFTVFNFDFHEKNVKKS